MGPMTDPTVTAALDDAALSRTAAWLGWNPGFAAAVRAAAARYRADPGRIALVREGAERLLGGGGKLPKGVWAHPELGVDEGMLPLFAVLTRLPEAVAGWNRRGVPEAVQVATLSDIEIWARVTHATK